MKHAEMPRRTPGRTGRACRQSLQANGMVLKHVNAALADCLMRGGSRDRNHEVLRFEDPDRIFAKDGAEIK
jgi:hypothetical protein